MTDRHAGPGRFGQDAPLDAPELHETPLPPSDMLVDVASDESFPASDPPSYPAVSASKPNPDEHQDVVPDPVRVRESGSGEPQ